MKSNIIGVRVFGSKKINSLIDRLSRKYDFAGVTREDLSQEAWLSIVQISDKLSGMTSEEIEAYIIPFVKRAMLDYSVANNRLVKMISTRKQQKVVCNIRKYIDGSEFLNKEIESKIALDLNVSISDVRTGYSFLFNPDESLTVYATESKKTPLELSVSSASNGLDDLDRQQKHELLYSAINTLSLKQAEVISKRWLGDEKRTQSEVSDEMGMARTGVQYLETEAIKKIKTKLLKAA